MLSSMMRNTSVRLALVSSEKDTRQIILRIHYVNQKETRWNSDL